MAGALFFILTDRACSVPSQFQEWFLFDFLLQSPAYGTENRRKRK